MNKIMLSYMSEMMLMARFYQVPQNPYQIARDNDKNNINNQNQVKSHIRVRSNKKVVNR